MRILALNGGSSSFKCWLGDLSGERLPVLPPRPVWEKRIDLNRDDRIEELLEPVLKSAPAPIDLVGHRIVHGGSAYRHSTDLTPLVRAAIAEQAEIAPAHNRLELAAMEAVEHVLGKQLRQIAVFDTGFHATLAPAAYVYAGPYKWLDQGIRRYGFHGISHQYAARRTAEILGNEAARLVICHLGNGASITAVQDGKSVDTSMGFTPLEGLMMGTRCGSIDPGIIVYLMRHHGYTADQLDGILNRESGLFGVSGVSGDMREILAAITGGNERAKLAFEIYIHRLTREIGAMIGVLGGVDALVFTGGVGENCPQVRDAVSKGFEFLRPKVLVIHAEEEWEIARECYRLATKKGTVRP